MHPGLSDRSPPVCVLASPESDPHTWSLVVLQLFLEERGWKAIVVGPCASPHLVVGVCLQTSADLLAVSSSNGNGLVEASALIAAVRRQPSLDAMSAVIGGKLTCDGTDAEAGRTLRKRGFDDVFVGADALAAFEQHIARLAVTPLDHGTLAAS